MNPKKHKLAVRIACLVIALLMVVGLLSTVLFSLAA